MSSVPPTHVPNLHSPLVILVPLHGTGPDPMNFSQRCHLSKRPHNTHRCMLSDCSAKPPVDIRPFLSMRWMLLILNWNQASRFRRWLLHLWK